MITDSQAPHGRGVFFYPCQQLQAPRVYAGSGSGCREAEQNVPFRKKED